MLKVKFTQDGRTLVAEVLERDGGDCYAAMNNRLHLEIVTPPYPTNFGGNGFIVGHTATASYTYAHPADATNAKQTFEKLVEEYNCRLPESNTLAEGEDLTVAFKQIGATVFANTLRCVSNFSKRSLNGFTLTPGDKTALSTTFVASLGSYAAYTYINADLATQAVATFSELIANKEKTETIGGNRLKVKFTLAGCKLTAQVLEQDESLRCLPEERNALFLAKNADYSICSNRRPKLMGTRLYVRGDDTRGDGRASPDTYDTPDEAAKALEAFKQLIKRINSPLQAEFERRDNVVIMKVLRAERFETAGQGAFKIGNLYNYGLFDNRIDIEPNVQRTHCKEFSTPEQAAKYIERAKEAIEWIESHL